jgi:ABC-2 type transport system ATP-binding protein
MISSHLLSEVQQVCDWLVVIKEGRRVFQGSTAQLLASGGDELVLGCQHPADLPRLGDMLGRRGLNWARDGNRLRVPLRHLQDLEHVRGLTDQIAGINRAAMAEDLTLIELTTTHASLEDRYESLMAEGAR